MVPRRTASGRECGGFTPALIVSVGAAIMLVSPLTEPRVPQLVGGVTARRARRAARPEDLPELKG